MVDGYANRTTDGLDYVWLVQCYCMLMFLTREQFYWITCNLCRPYYC